MITVERIGGGKDCESAQFRGKSTDTPPTEATCGTPIPNGSELFLFDTREVLFYDQEVDDWLDKDGNRLHVNG